MSLPPLGPLWFPSLASCKQYHSGHGSTDDPLALWIQFLWIDTQNRIVRSYDSSIFSIFGGISILLSKMAVLIYHLSNSYVQGFPFL